MFGRRSSIPLTLALLSLSASQAHAYRVNFYKGEACNGQAIGNFIGGPGAGCVTDGVDTGTKSVILESTGPVDDNFYIIFYKSDDCNPLTEIVAGDDISLKGCTRVPGYHSFEIVDLAKA